MTTSPSDRPAGDQMLSVRERQVFRRMALGQTTARIAKDMGISPHTVGTYRSRVRRKLGLIGEPAQAVTIVAYAAGVI